MNFHNRSSPRCTPTPSEEMAVGHRLTGTSKLTAVEATPALPHFSVLMTFPTIEASSDRTSAEKLLAVTVWRERAKSPASESELNTRARENEREWERERSSSRKKDAFWWFGGGLTVFDGKPRIVKMCGDDDDGF